MRNRRDAQRLKLANELITPMSLGSDAISTVAYGHIQYGASRHFRVKFTAGFREMGYYQNTSENWQDSESAQIARQCSWCGGEFYPDAPHQRRHSYQQEPACFEDHRKQNMSRNGWIRACTGYTVAEFIEQYGMESYLSL